MCKQFFCIDCGTNICRNAVRCCYCAGIKRFEDSTKNPFKNQTGKNHPCFGRSKLNINEYNKMKGIQEEITFKSFGYYPYELSKSSHKKIFIQCQICKKIRQIEYKQYFSICAQCAHRQRRKVYQCIEEDCKNKIHIQTALYGNHRCKSCAKKGKLNSRYGKITHGNGSYYKQSWMRSSWEIVYAKYCIKNHIKYRYEPKVFEIVYKYKGIKKEGTYRPDFYLPEQDLWVEIKGWWREDAKAKCNAFKKRYSNINFSILRKTHLIKLGVL